MTTRAMGTIFTKPINASNIITYIETLVGSVTLAGADDLVLGGTCDSRAGGHGQLVFADLEHFAKGAELTACLVLIDTLPDESARGSNQFCVVADPRAVFMDVLTWLIASVGLDAHWCGFSRQASVSADAQVAPSAVIEPGVEIGAGSVISAGAVIKRGSRIGCNTLIRENVVIGSDGLTRYRAADGRLLKFPHIGGVSIGDNTEVGVNTVIAGGILAATFIGNEVVIGNLCNIGHGSTIEDGVWMSVGSLLGGHTTLHAGATVAMDVSVRDNLEIGADASLGMGSVVVKNVEPHHSMFGNPAKRMVGLKTGPKR